MGLVHTTHCVSACTFNVPSVVLVMGCGILGDDVLWVMEYWVVMSYGL